MKKVCLFSLVLALCSISFFGCKNFMESEDFLTQLNDSVKYSNAPYAHVEIKADSHAILSIMPAVGEYNSHFKAGDKITLKFEEQEAYNFVEWVATPENAVIFDDAKERSTKAKIVSTEEPIVIEAYTVLRDKLQVKFKWDQGSVSVPSSSSFYLDEEFSFRYNPNNDYAFVRWEISDGKGNVRNDILQLSGNGIDETAKVLKVNENITIKAVSSKRPKVVSYSPLFTSDGVYRDRRIVVMFDQDIDESSIYFDVDEQEELKSSGYTLEFDTAKGRTDKCYAYKDKKGNLHWKNITIELRKVGTSYEEYYNAPYFDENDKSVLYIDPNQSNPPPGGKEILVTLSQKMNSYKNKTELANECGWAYFTNGNIDKEGPQFADNFEVTFNDKNIKDINIDNIDELPLVKITSNKIRMTVKGSYVDDGAGAGPLNYQVIQVDSPYYDKCNEKLPSGNISVEISKTTAEVADKEQNIDIEINEDGIYRIDIFAEDCNGKRTDFKEKFYFVKDNTPPEEPLVYSGSLNNGVRLFIDMSKEPSKDIKNVKITEQDEATIDINNNNIVDKIFKKDSSNGQEWYYTVIVSDYAGNTVKKRISTYPGLKYGYYCYLTENNNVYFSPSNDNEVGVLQGVVIDNCPYIKGYNNEFITGETVKILSKDFYIPESGEKLPVTTKTDNMDKKIYVRRDNGLEVYKNILNNEVGYVRTFFPLIYDIWEYKNKENSSAIIWYIPSIGELKNIVDIDSDALRNNKFNPSGEKRIRIINSLDKNAISICSSSFVDSSSLQIEYRSYNLSSGTSEEKTQYLYSENLDKNFDIFVYLLMAQVDPTK